MPARPASLKAKEPHKREPLPGFGSATARIAHRFAPRQQAAPSPSPLRPDTPPSRSSVAADLGISPRALIGSLAALALLPNLTVAAYLWLPARHGHSVAADATAPQASPAPASLAAIASKPAPPPAKPERVRPVLSAPDHLEASASGDIELALSLDGTDGVPARSSIAISGLPAGATLSSGRPYGETGWNLKSDEIGDLKLNLPDTASGDAKLAIELVSPHGDVISSAETTIKVSAAPEAGLEPEPVPGVPGEAPAAPSEAHAAPVRKVATVSIPDPVKMDAPEDAQVAAAAGEAKTKPATARNAKPMALASAEDADADAETITPAKFVNLRSGPTSSASVLAVVPRGAKLAVLDRKRGWVQVTHPTTAETGWIYAGNLDGAPKRTRRTATKPAETSESFWSYLGRTLRGSSSDDEAQ